MPKAEKKEGEKKESGKKVAGKDGKEPVEIGSEETKEKKRKRTKHQEDEDSELEERYFEKSLKEDAQGSKKARSEKTVADKSVEVEAKEESLSSSSDEAQSATGGKIEEEEEDENTKTYVHESLLPNQGEIDKAKSTIFIGNVPREVVSDKHIYKKFRDVFATAGKVQSVRFRSIAFSELLPRKAAFAQKKFDESRDAINAYIVFDKEASVKEAVSKLNATVFENHHLRVDSVAHPLPQDNKKCVFVGNMDFEESEESLWRHFGTCGKVENVRIVRDTKTNMGKGFGYVQFKDSLSVTKALLLDGKKMKSATKTGKERTLRVNRSKAIRKSKNDDKPKQRLTGDSKTKLGRAKAVLGKAGRSQVNQIIEGHRATPGEVIKGLTGKKRENKKRITKRSTAFKSKNAKK